jgi:hypothetical protein
MLCVGMYVVAGFAVPPRLASYFLFTFPSRDQRTTVNKNRPCLGRVQPAVPLGVTLPSHEADYSPLPTALNMWILPPPILALCLDAGRHIFIFILTEVTL